MPVCRRSLLPQYLLRLLAVLLGGTIAARLWAEEGRLFVQVYPPAVTGGVYYHWTGVQDKRGQLYFGSDVILSFDGERWRHYEVPGAREFRALALGQDGRLWVGGLNEIGYFERNLSGDLQNYHSLTALLPPDTPPIRTVWQVLPRGQGAVFVSNELVIVWDGRRFQIHPLSGARRIPAMEVNGEIYISHSKRGLWHLTANALELAVPPEILNQPGTLWIDPTPQGWLLATARGLAILEDGRLRPFAPEIADKLSQSILSAACRLRDGRICVGTITAGLAVLTRDGQLERWITPADGLQSNAVLALLPTADGGLWVSSQLGLARVTLSGGVTVFDASRGVTSRPINSVAEVDQRILLATNDGIEALPFSAGPDARFGPLPQWRRLANDVIGDDDDLYVASFRGAFNVQGTQVTQILATDTDVVRILPRRTRPGRLLLCGALDLLQVERNAPGKFTVITSTAFTEPPVPLVEDTAATLWVGSRAHGLFTLRLNPGSEPQPYVLPDAPEPSGRAVVGRAGEAIVLATRGRLAVKLPDRPAPILVAHAPETVPLHASAADRPDAVWLAYECPFAHGQHTPLIGRLSLDRGAPYTWTPMSVPGLEEIGEINRLFVDSRGILWIAGGTGVIRLDPTQAHPLPAPMAPVIHADIAYQARLPFSHHGGTIFDFGALEYEQRATLHFQTQLSGVDPDWTAPSATTQLTLAGDLHEGDYELSVRVVNAAGIAGPATRWPFTILPPWYRTKLAYSGWTLLAVAGVLGFVQWRSNHLRRRAAQLEALVAKKTAELAAANEAKSEFIATMSHEIRNPISGLVGLAAAMEETPLDSRQQHLSDSIRHCANLLSTLVDEVLDFAKIEAGHIELRLAPFDLRAVLTRCGEMVRETYGTTRSALEFDLAADLPPCVLGDAARVQQIALNYLTNAAKFSPGLPVTLGAALIGGDRVRLFVCDRGPGMTAAEAATLFTKYTRLHRAQTVPVRGTGLGLAVCRLLTTKMGGRVGVETAPGAGATFWAELPLPAATAAPLPAPAPPPTRKLHALVVEDLDYNAIAMLAVLQKVGVTAEVAPDGPTALARLQAATFDLIFMDWSLPGMDGLEVARRFRASEPPGRHTIIIASTAYSTDADRDACLQAGMDAFVAKPFTPEKLRQALQDLGAGLRSNAPVETRPIPEPPPPVVTTSSSVTSLDLELLQILAEGEPGGLRAQLDRYFAETVRLRQQLGQAIAARAAADIGRAAHRLLSQANMIKCQPLIRLASELEALAATADTDRLQGLTADYDDAFARLRESLADLPPAAPPA